MKNDNVRIVILGRVYCVTECIVGIGGEIGRVENFFNFGNHECPPFAGR